MTAATHAEIDLTYERTVRELNSQYEADQLIIAEDYNGFARRIAVAALGIVVLAVLTFLLTADSLESLGGIFLIGIPVVSAAVFYIGYLVGVKRKLADRRRQLQDSALQGGDSKL